MVNFVVRVADHRQNLLITNDILKQHGLTFHRGIRRFICQCENIMVSTSDFRHLREHDITVKENTKEDIIRSILPEIPSLSDEDYYRFLDDDPRKIIDGITVRNGE